MKNIISVRKTSPRSPSLDRIQLRSEAVINKVERTMNVLPLGRMEGNDEVSSTRRVQSLSTVTIGARLVPSDPQILRHTQEIELLKKKLEGKDEEILQLNKEIKKLRAENDELKVDLESKNKKIKHLEGRIEELECDKTELETKLSSVEVELAAVKKQVTKLKEANKTNEELNATLEEKLEKMSKKVDEMKTTIEETVEENSSLKREIKNVQEIVQIRAAIEVRDSMALPEYSAVDPMIDLASLYLGELCCQVQAMMYQRVLPNSYDDKKGYMYKVKHIEEDIDEIDDEKSKNEAKRRWAELKKKLNWKNSRQNYKRAMKYLQESRNKTVHPDLSEEVLMQSLALMAKQGKLTGWYNPECVKELIEMWKTLKQ